MFAIVRTGSKQFKVEANDVILAEKIEAQAGDVIHLDQVLLIGNGDDVTFGTPLIPGAIVVAKVEAQQRTDKVIVFKKKRRQNYRRKNTHRQHQTALRIVEISVDGKVSATKATAPKAEKAPAAKKAAAEKPAAKKAAEAKPAAKKTAAKKTKA
jgi:large subunit ribosomal protein L21